MIEDFKVIIGLGGTEKEINISDMKVFTIHALAYQELKQINELPHPFNEMPVYNEIKEKQPKGKDFRELLLVYIKNIENGKLCSGYLKNIDILAIDEYQNLDKDSIVLIKSICKRFNLKIIVAGDPFQSIYCFDNKRKILNNFDNIKKDFNIEPNYFYLNENRRSNPAILNMINGYLENVSNIPDILKYNNLPINSTKNYFAKRDCK